jgi:hypothetical protein
VGNKIVVTNKFVVGSNIFFNEFESFVSKDIDYLCIMSEPFCNDKTKSFLISNNGNDYILYSNLSKQEFLENDLKSNDSIKLGKYLCKDFIDYIGLTIDDLKELKPLCNGLDDKHKYEKIIYDAYIDNDDFILNDDQLNLAYNAYKMARAK